MRHAAGRVRRQGNREVRSVASGSRMPMKLGRRTVYAAMLALVCLNLLLRFPRTVHEAGVDSFFIHTLATAITQNGSLPWVLNPLGYFGWYPLSYPSASPILISGFAQVTGVTEEGAILVLSMLFGPLGALVSFAMARAFRNDDVFALTVAVIFSLAPRFLNFTLWSASSRNLFMILIPVFVWMLVRTYRRPSGPNNLILISTLVLMLATHRLTILLATVVLAFVVAYVFILLHRVLRLRFPRSLLSPAFRRWAPRVAIIAIVGIAAFMLVGTQVLEEYSTGEVCSGNSPQAQLCNLGVSISRSVGLALPFALVGVFEVIRQPNKGFLEAFIVLSLLALIPTLFLRQYTGFYILPFLALFAGLGLVLILRAFGKRRRARNAVLVASLIVISGFSLVVLEVELERGTAMSDYDYTTALYVQGLPAGHLISNDGLLGIRVSSVSGRGLLPVGGAGTTTQSPELLTMGAYSASEVLRSTEPIDVWKLTVEDDSPFTLKRVNALEDWQLRFLFRDVDNVEARDLNRYKIAYFLENDALRGKYIAYTSVYYGDPFSNFANSVHAKRYKVLDVASQDLYFAFPQPGR